MGMIVPILEGVARGSAGGALLGAGVGRLVLEGPEMEGFFTTYGGAVGGIVGGIVGAGNAGVIALQAGDLDFLSM